MEKHIDVLVFFLVSTYMARQGLCLPVMAKSQHLSGKWHYDGRSSIQIKFSSVQSAALPRSLLVSWRLTSPWIYILSPAFSLNRKCRHIHFLTKPCMRGPARTVRTCTWPWSCRLCGVSHVARCNVSCSGMPTFLWWEGKVSVLGGWVIIHSLKQAHTQRHTHTRKQSLRAREKSAFTWQHRAFALDINM